MTEVYLVEGARDIWSAGHGVSAVQKRETTRETIAQLMQKYEEGVASFVRND